MGTLLCHHFQSLASRLNTLPDADVINVESYDMSAAHMVVSSDLLTKSKAAILVLLLAACLVPEAVYRPTRRESFTMRQDILSGSFLERGVKKFATALSVIAVSILVHEFPNVSLLVVVDCCLRFDGGGDTPLSFELGRFDRLGRSAILPLSLREGVVICCRMSVDHAS